MHEEVFLIYNIVNKIFKGGYLMSTPHINAKEGAFAKVVLMPGDPLRAKWIAETFLRDFEEVTNVRGILGFTGYTKNGKRLSVMASGMGMPSIGIYSHELFTEYGVEAIIRVGTAGGYLDNIHVKDVLICTTASTDSNWAGQYGLNGHYSAGASFDMAVEAYNKSKELNIVAHAGSIFSSDVFYDVEPDSWKKWAALGVMGVEMESYALYVEAARLHKKALCLLTVSNHFTYKEDLTSDERVTSLSNMIELAIATAEKYC